VTPGQQSEIDCEIDREVAAGRAINAIRLYRLATGASLRASKDYVEARERSLAPKGASTARGTAPLGPARVANVSPIFLAVVVAIVCALAAAALFARYVPAAH
jgi:hypothetical protein